MKKIVLTLLLRLSLLSSFSIGESGLDINNKQETEIKNEVVDSTYGFYFCNNKNNPQSRLDIMTAPLQKNEICLYFYNNSDSNKKIKVEFVDGALNNNNIESCATTTGKFGSYVTKDRGEEIIIPANSHIMKKATLSFPIHVSGKTHGCLATTLIKDKKEETSGMFNLVFRKGYIVRAFVGNINITGGNNTTIDNIEVEKGDNNEITISWKLENKGIMDSKIDIHGTIEDYFGFKQNFDITGFILTVGGVKTIKSTALKKIILPKYKGLFNITLTMNWKPYIENFDINSLGLDPSILEGKTVITKKTYIEMPRGTIGIIILIILLLFLAFRKKKQKVVYVQQPQQPTSNI